MPAGRPPRYKVEYAELAFSLTLLGKTNSEMAKIIGVNDRTFDKWLIKHTELSRSIARGKDEADGKISVSLYERAKGYSHEAVKIMQYEGNVIEVPYTQHYPPDTQAASLWLRNRQPRLWRDKTEIEHGISQEFADRLVRARERAKSE